MSKMIHLLTTLSAYFWLASCGVQPDVVATTAESALTTGACVAAGNPPRSADVTYSSGTCQRYSMSSTPLTQQNYLIPSGTLGTVVSVRTGNQAAAWVCDTASPRGFTDARFAPCWSGGVNNGFVRIRGAWDAGSQTYLNASGAVINIVGRSFVLTLGSTLCTGTGCTLPACNSSTALNWHPFGGPFNGDVGLNSYTANNDPADGPGSQLTAAWPDGTSGSPCIVNSSPTGYAEIYYAAF